MKYQISLLQKALYSMMMLAIFLAAFGNWNFRSVHAAGTHQITYFRDNKAGAVSFTFDDGYTSQAATVVNELNIRGLKGTFFVITGSDWINSHVPWATWQSLVAQGHEVAAHTVTHQDLTTLSEGETRWEMTESEAAIMQNVPGQACASLSYPTTASNPTVQAAASDYFVAARGGFLGDGYLNYYQSGSDQSGSWTAMNFYNIGSRSSDGLIPTTDQYFNSLLNTAAARHAWFSLHFHTINASAFATILDYIQGKPEYWIDTFCNISRYMKERLNSTVQVITDTPSEIRLNVVMDPSLSTSIYSFPLTIRSTIPASWTQVIVQQGSAIQTLTPVLEGSENVVYYNAVPNGGDVSLTISTPTATPTITLTYTPTITPTITPSPILTFTPSGTPTATATSVTATPSFTTTPTGTTAPLPWYAPTGSTAVTAVTNPNNAFTSNNAYATFNANGNTVNYTAFGVSAIPAGATINGIEVSVEGYNGQAAGRNLQIQISWDGGTNFTTVTAARTTNLPITDGIVILGGAIDTWGRAWSTTEFTNANFTVKATSTGGPVPPVNLDQLRVSIYYSVAGNTPTAIATFTPTNTPTVAATSTSTNTTTFTPTNTLTSAPTFTKTNTPTVTPINTLTYTSTSTSTVTPTNTLAYTLTYTATNTSTYTPTSMPTFTETNTPTVIPINTLTYTPTYTSTNTSTTTVTSVPTFTQTNTPSITPTDTLTYTPTYIVTNTSTTTATSIPTFTETNTPTVIPTITSTSAPTFTQTNTSTITPTDTLTYTPTSTPTFTPTNTSTSVPTFTETNTPTVTPTNTLTYTPTYTATNTSTSIPTSTPTFTPTNTSTSEPTFTKTNTPTVTLTNTATNTSTNTPTIATNTPTVTRTNTPTNLPTNTAIPTNTLPPPTATNTPLSGPANTGFLNPSANAAQTGGDGNGYQTNSTNAYTDNGVFAVDTDSGTGTGTSCTGSGKDKHNFYNYGFSIPGTTILGIEVRLDAKADSTSGAPKLCIQLSWDAGTSWTTAKQTGTLTTTEQTYTLGSASDNWGHTWTLSQLSNANFRVRIIDVATNTSRDFSLDWITVRVTYQ